MALPYPGGAFLIMADFTRNIDKWTDCNLSDLYNSVLIISVSSEGSEPVILQEAKDWGKIEQDVDDDIVTALITAARRMCESYTGISFITKTVAVGVNNSNGNFTVPYGPVTSTPTAVDVYGNTLDITYELGQVVEPYGRMTLTYDCGYSTLPEDLKTALKAQILFLYENRGEGTVALSPIAKMILAPLRVVV